MFRDDVNRGGIMGAERVTAYRLICGLAVVLIPLFAVPYHMAMPGSVDPVEIRLALGAPFAGLLGLSYTSVSYQRALKPLCSLLLWLVMGWFTVIAALNAFVPAYALGLMFTFMATAVAQGLVTSRRWSHDGFFVAGPLATGIALWVVPKSVMSPPVVMGMMVGTGVVMWGAAYARRRALEALQRSENLLQRMSKIARIGGWELDLTTETLTWSKETFSIYGFDPEHDTEPTIEEVLQFYAADAEEKFDRAVQQAIEQGTSFDFELPVQTADDRQIWVRSMGEVEVDDGAPVRLWGTVQDVTARRLIEEELRQERDLLERIMATSVAALAVVDTEGHIVFANKRAEEVLLLEPSSVPGQNYTDPTWRLTDFDGTPLPLEEQPTRRVQRTGEPIFGARYAIERSDGERRLLSINAAPLTDNSEEVVRVVLSISDVTEQIERENELRRYASDLEAAKEALEENSQQLAHTVFELEQAREQAEAATKAKSEFLANMSHEIRTPMNGVIGMTNLLLDTDLDAEQRDYTETIRASGDALLDLINDILDFSKIEAGRLKLEEQPFAVSQCIEEALELVMQRAGEKGLRLAYHIEPDVPGWIVSDVTRVRQVLVNLLSNAVKFTEEGEVVVHVQRSHRSNGTEDNVELAFSVRDTGIGIPADKQDQLFDSFAQVDTSTTRKYGGTGLGLTISKQLTELMGGEISVESEEGVGATFTFTIRARPTDELDRSAHRRGKQASLEGLRALVIDDHATNRTILRRYGEQWGLTVEEASSARAGLRHVTADPDGPPFDVVLLDFQMPGMDGITLTEKIRTKWDAESLPVVMLTSVGCTATHTDAKAAGCNVALSKPIKPDALLDTLLKIFGEEADRAALRDEGEAGASRFDTRLADRHPLHILVAEDNPINQKVARRQLRQLGYRADIVANGAEAVEAAQRQPYDVILMDVQMPEMDGIAATREIIASCGADRPYIIAMTAAAMEGDKKRCLEVGMDDYVSKPVEVEVLVEALRRCARQVGV